MHWIAPLEKDTANATLENRLRHAGEEIRTESAVFFRQLASTA